MIVVVGNLSGKASEENNRTSNLNWIEVLTDSGRPGVSSWLPNLWCCEVTLKILKRREEKRRVGNALGKREL